MKKLILKEEDGDGGLDDHKYMPEEEITLFGKKGYLVDMDNPPFKDSGSRVKSFVFFISDSIAASTISTVDSIQTDAPIKFVEDNFVRIRMGNLTGDEHKYIHDERASNDRAFFMMNSEDTYKLFVSILKHHGYMAKKADLHSVMEKFKNDPSYYPQDLYYSAVMGHDWYYFPKAEQKKHTGLRGFINNIIGGDE